MPKGAHTHADTTADGCGVQKQHSPSSTTSSATSRYYTLRKNESRSLEAGSATRGTKQQIARDHETCAVT